SDRGRLPDRRVVPPGNLVDEGDGESYGRTAPRRGYTMANRSVRFAFGVAVVCLALTGRARVAEALHECDSPETCGNGNPCCENPDGSFAGCCTGGTCCPGPDGNIIGCCFGATPICDSVFGICSSTCPAGSTACHNHCVSCGAGLILDLSSCACILPC